MLRSKDRFRIVNYVASVIKDMRPDQVKRVMIAAYKDSMMLKNVNMQPLDYG